MPSEASRPRIRVASGSGREPFTARQHTRVVMRALSAIGSTTEPTWGGGVSGFSWGFIG